MHEQRRYRHHSGLERFYFPSTRLSASLRHARTQKRTSIASMKTGTVFALLGLGSLPAQAACDLAATTSGSTASRIAALAQCVADLQEENNGLRNDLAAKDGHTHAYSGSDHTHAFAATDHSHAGTGIPAGAVIAFDAPTQCPADWSPFAPAQGRTIIGASFGLASDLFREDHEATPRKYRDHGGQETVVLGIDHMPTHSHGMDLHVSGREFPWFSTLKETPLPTSDVHSPSRLKVFEQGGNKRHENMPPWIALYYCIKD